MQLGSFQISDDLRIGDDLTHVILDANAASQIFDIEALETYTLENLTLINGRAQQGGALHIQGNGKLISSVQFSEVTFRDNEAIEAGGAIYSDNAVLVVDLSPDRLEIRPGFPMDRRVMEAEFMPPHPGFA